ncbi:uncharacterized protein LOC131876440 [Cryptomeria japonica]|uniref:uncharacterized protein LOC131876440 n=1 Tax=Cryptomeria japonica TaxID=3369 RepID=UPI0027D9CF9F|nr:uncharacterized protein LOC131876440 [Cryptomeria japonica]
MVVKELKLLSPPRDWESLVNSQDDEDTQPSEEEESPGEGYSKDKSYDEASVSEDEASEEESTSKGSESSSENEEINLVVLFEVTKKRGKFNREFSKEKRQKVKERELPKSRKQAIKSPEDSPKSDQEDVQSTSHGSPLLVDDQNKETRDATPKETGDVPSTEKAHEKEKIDELVDNSVRSSRTKRQEAEEEFEEEDPKVIKEKEFQDLQDNVVKLQIENQTLLEMLQEAHSIINSQT